MKVDDYRSLRDEIAKLVAAALEVDRRHVDEVHRRDDLHVREMDRRDTLHHDEIQRRSDRHDDELTNIRVALETRDIIGQAKGVLMATLRVSADRAFHLLRTQSQYENRKVVDVAVEIVHRAAPDRPADGPVRSAQTGEPAH